MGTIRIAGLVLISVLLAFSLPRDSHSQTQGCDPTVTSTLTDTLGLKKLGYRQCYWHVPINESFDLIDAMASGTGVLSARPVCTAGRLSKLYVVTDCWDSSCASGGGTLDCITRCDGSSWVVTLCDTTGAGSSLWTDYSGYIDVTSGDAARAIIQDKGGEVWHAEAYGVDCADGAVGSDNAAITAMFTASGYKGRHVFPPEICYINKSTSISIPVSTDGMTIEGAGPNVTIFKYTGGDYLFKQIGGSIDWNIFRNFGVTLGANPLGAFEFYDEAGGNRFNHIESVYVNGTGGSQVGVIFHGASECNCFNSIENCNFSTLGTGIRFSGYANGNRLSGNHFTADTYGLRFEETPSDAGLGAGGDNYIERTEIDSSTNGLVMTDIAMRNTFDTLRMENVTNAGSLCDGCDGNVFIGSSLNGGTLDMKLLGSAQEKTTFLATRNAADSDIAALIIGGMKVGYVDPVMQMSAVGWCDGGTNDGLTCYVDTDCPGGGTCDAAETFKLMFDGADFITVNSSKSIETPNSMEIQAGDGITKLWEGSVDNFLYVKDSDSHATKYGGDTIEADSPTQIMSSHAGTDALVLRASDAAGTITVKPGGDLDDYLVFKTANNVAGIMGNDEYIRVGDAGFTSHGLAANDDLLVSGKLEVDGEVSLDALATGGANQCLEVDTDGTIVKAAAACGTGGSLWTDHTGYIDVTSGDAARAAIQDKGGQVYNVKAYGAAGDVVTDDTDEINAMLDASSHCDNGVWCDEDSDCTGVGTGHCSLRRGHYEFPAGVYKFTSSLKFPKVFGDWGTSSGLIVSGAGAANTVLDYTGSDWAFVLNDDTGYAGGDVRHCVFENLTIRINSSAAGAVLMSDPTNGCLFNGVHFVGYGTSKGVGIATVGTRSCNCHNRFDGLEFRNLKTGVLLSGYANANEFHSPVCATVGKCMDFEAYGANEVCTSSGEPFSCCTGSGTGNRTDAVCIGGANDGDPCSDDSECPDGRCASHCDADTVSGSPKAGEANLIERLEMDGTTTLGISMEDNADGNVFLKCVSDGTTNSLTIADGVDNTIFIGCSFAQAPSISGTALGKTLFLGTDPITGALNSRVIGLGGSAGSKLTSDGTNIIDFSGSIRLGSALFGYSEGKDLLLTAGGPDGRVILEAPDMGAIETCYADHTCVYTGDLRLDTAHKFYIRDAADNDYVGQQVPDILTGSAILEWGDDIHHCAAGEMIEVANATGGTPNVVTLECDTLGSSSNVTFNYDLIVAGGNLTIGNNTANDFSIDFDDETGSMRSLKWISSTDKFSMTNNLVLDTEAAGDSPSFVLQDDGDKTFSLMKDTDGFASLINDEGEIRFLSSADSDDYIILKTPSSIPSILGYGSYLRIGDTNATGHSLAQGNDLLVEGELEVDGATYLDGTTAAKGNVTLSDGSGDSPSLTFTPQTGTPWSIYSDNTDNALKITSDTATTEYVDIQNTSTGDANLRVDGAVSVTCTPGSSDCVIDQSVNSTDAGFPGSGLVRMYAKQNPTTLKGEWYRKYGTDGGPNQLATIPISGSDLTDATVSQSKLASDVPGINFFGWYHTLGNADDVCIAYNNTGTCTSGTVSSYLTQYIVPKACTLRNFFAEVSTDILTGSYVITVRREAAESETATETGITCTIDATAGRACSDTTHTYAIATAGNKIDVRWDASDDPVPTTVQRKWSILCN